jgi:hypothetical protein
MTHPDEEISKEYRAAMNGLAKDLDAILNGGLTGEDRTVCFTLLITDFNKSSRVNYISNGQREDIIVMMKEVLARFQGQPEQKGTA